VGGSSVAINEIGSFGQVTSNLSIEYLIFADVNGSAPLLKSAVDTLSVDASPVWHDSQVFSPFTLNANSTYWIGFAVSGSLGSYTDYGVSAPSSDFSQNGLTIRGNTNGNVRTSFSNPIGNMPSGNVQIAIRLFAADVSTPEPSTLMMTVAPVMLGLLLLRRSSNRQQV
jgi:hypothetical protein